MKDFFISTLTDEVSMSEKFQYYVARITYLSLMYFTTFNTYWTNEGNTCSDSRIAESFNTSLGV